MASVFKCKQFDIKQDRCAMKIGTDAILLGAWASLDKNPQYILDIGAGTGIIALQMAQRSGAQVIDAIEINSDAFEQCVENFENSKWNGRLFCYHSSLEEFTEEIEVQYDHIISNPPFYSDDFGSRHQARDLARFSNYLPFDELIKGTSSLLSENGIFCLILPNKEEKQFIRLASKQGLFPNKICRVRGKVSSEVKRTLFEFSFHKTIVLESELTIEIERHRYTEEYIDLTKEFYLNMP